MLQYLADVTGSQDRVVVLIALIAALPGVGSLVLGWYKRRDLNEATATEFGTKLAGEAFRNMEAQVKRLTDEQTRYDIERLQWMRDKNQLLVQISEMTEQLRVTNQYLGLLLGTLDVHGIAHPVPPLGFPLPPPTPPGAPTRS